MIKTILVDSDKSHIREFENMLAGTKTVHISGVYTDVISALNAIKRSKPDVVFMNTEMPFICGTDMVQIIQDLKIKTEIVFISESSHYAVQAFELCAIDYLLKPIRQNRLRITVDRINKKLSTK